MNFTDVLVVGVIATLLMVTGSAVFIANMDAYGLNTSEQQYAQIVGQNTDLIDSISDVGDTVVQSINKTEPQQQNFVQNAFSFLSDISAWFGIIKVLFNAVFTVLALPVTLIKYMLLGISEGLGVPFNVSLIIGSVVAILTIMVVGYVIYLFIGRGGKQDNVI